MYELATFRKDHKGGDNIKLSQVQHGTHADDAARRDLTINSMYIQLDNPDGENKKLIDHHGGIHDIKAGLIKFVGNAKDRLEEDPIRALRAVRFAHRFGKGSAAVSPEDKKEIHNIIDAIKERVAPERIQAELKKGIGYKDVDPTKYLKSLEEFRLLDIVFPGLNKNTDFPEEMGEFHSSPHHMLAHVLKGNQDLKGLSSSLNKLKYSNDDSDKIGHLIKMLRFNSDNVDPDQLEQLMKSHLKSGLPNKSVSNWMTKVGKRPPHEADALFQHFGAPRIKVAHGGGNGPFDDLMNPITGNPNPMTAHMIGGRKKGMEHQNFHKLLQGLAPKKEM
jgi:tRNA nucleotidyltransferase/poly(A) polymerase